MDTDAIIYPFGFESELAGSQPCYRKRTEYGWEVHRQYLTYDGRPATDLLAIHQTEQEAILHESRIVAAVKAERKSR